MKIGALIVSDKAGESICLDCGSSIGAYLRKLDELVLASGVIAKGKSTKKYDVGIVLSSSGIERKRKFK